MPGNPESQRSRPLLAVAGFGRRWLVLILLLASGCRSVEPTGATIRAPHARDSLTATASHVRREGLKLERRGVDQSVDRYYEAVAFATAALNAAIQTAGAESEAVASVRDLYNGCVGDCLRTAQVFGRFDPAGSLRIETPMGTRFVPVKHFGFVWKPTDFGRMFGPQEIRRNSNSHANADFAGIGAGVAVERQNPRAEPQDAFLSTTAVFNATVLLRPDLSVWLGEQAARTEDVLEFHDPLRVRDVSFGSAPSFPLRADLRLASALASQNQETQGPFALEGFARPEEMLSRAAIRMLEPYQPGKAPVLLIHGLLSDPFTFTDMMVSLQRTPGFLDRHQIWVYRYPTGVTFIRTAAILREQLKRIGDTLDPASADSALADVTLVGHSMGGLLARLLISWSGMEIWNEIATRPYEEVRMSEASRKTIRELMFFEPSPRVRRVIFVATPHAGASPAIASASWLTTRLIQRPADTRQILLEVEAANPGVIRSGMRDLPSSVDALAAYSPILPGIRRMRINPDVVIHTIAGTGVHTPPRGWGDAVVPLTSAHIDGAVSEHHVQAYHNTILYNTDAIDEVRRILGVSRP